MATTRDSVGGVPQPDRPIRSTRVGNAACLDVGAPCDPSLTINTWSAKRLQLGWTSAAGELRTKTLFGQHGHDPLPVVALDFDFPVADGTASGQG